MASETMEMNGDADRLREDRENVLEILGNTSKKRKWGRGREGEMDRSSVGVAPQQGRRRRMSAPLNMNHYANKKSAAESMLDVALLMANASQLKAVMEQGPSFTFYTPIITLISISLILQITVGVLLIFIVKWNLNDESKHYQLNVLENVSTALVFIIAVVNIFITAFGVQRPNTGA